MQVTINGNIYRQAQTRATEQGLSLPTVIENFLVRFIGNTKVQQETVPDVVLSLLGAAKTGEKAELSSHEAYSQYLEEKYK
ncbi:MAG: hypothetical protein IJ605_00360 [Prevotella sp.]|nr:hypothetical protein [Prevotella sp.]